MNRPVILVHGGAWSVPVRLHETCRAGCRRAALTGWERLIQGGSALDAVEAAVRVMESEPVFDAGCGSYFNSAGEVEMDAAVMDGRTLDLGAVAAIQGVSHPVSVARLVLERSPHNFYVGAGAGAFARESGAELCGAMPMGRREEVEEAPWRPGDTVGAVALDLAGNLAVAASTGGTPNKQPGRVGDTPLVGSGIYADNLTAAAAATGDGEKLMRVVISKAACDYVAAGLPAQAAAEAMIRLLAERVNGHGGIIIIDREGRVGLAHNTPHMSHAYILPGQDVVVGIE